MEHCIEMSAVGHGDRHVVFKNHPRHAVELRVNIYRPDKPGRFQVLMLMGPYGKDTSYAAVPAYRASWGG